MNFLDKFIGYFDPERAFRRERFRAAMEVLAYDGAKSGRRTDGWIAASGDANSEVGAALASLRNRSRDLLRNNPYAAKAVTELVGNTVGTGIVPQAKTGDEALDKLIDGEWPYFAENCDPGGQLDFYGMQALIVRTTAESGDGIARFRPRLPQDNLRVPLQLEMLEADYLDLSKTMGTEAGWIIQGVQFSKIGQREAYWLFNYHPGGVYIMNPRGGILSQPVPADQVMHQYCLLRPGQVRGVPWLAPVMLALRDLDDYRDAERMRKKTEACLAAIVTRPDGAGGLPLGAKSTDPKTGMVLEGMYPGMIGYLKPGEDVRFNTPQAAGGYREYLMTELQGIGAGVDVPYELLSGDLSNVNYSSYRAGMLGFRNTIEAFRWLTLIPMFCRPTWRRFIDTLVLVGKIPGPNYGVQWTAPKFESVDPLKDAMAELKRIRTGTLTLSEAIAQNGYDPEKQLQEIARLNKLLDDLEIILDCDPRRTNERGAQQPGETPDPGEAAGQDPNSDVEDEKQKRYGTSAGRAWDNPSRLYRS
jgi:lambda family phage portal protein